METLKHKFKAGDILKHKTGELTVLVRGVYGQHYKLENLKNKNGKALGYIVFIDNNYTKIKGV